MGGSKGTVLVAGATGALGREVVRELARRGFGVRALVRDAARGATLGAASVHVGDALKAETLAGAFDGVVSVFSCLGASVQPETRFGRASFGRVDWPANRHLVDAAKAAGVKRIVYVSVFGAQGSRGLDYMDAHEKVVDHVRASGLSCAIIRPTGFFSAFEAFLELARKGQAPVIGDGSARTNPIDDRDLAVVCVDAIEAGTEGDVEVGGPQTLTRREIAELACRVQNAPVRTRGAPAGLFRFVAWVLRPLHPRIAAVIAFVTDVSTHDCVAKAHGTRTLEGYFQERLTAAVSAEVARARGA